MDRGILIYKGYVVKYVGCTELSSARDGYHFQITTLHILAHSLKIDVFFVPLFHDNGSKNHTTSKMFLL